jgi:hypothetical protein
MYGFMLSSPVVRFNKRELRVRLRIVRRSRTRLASARRLSTGGAAARL